ncbi:MAG: hypothetical protein DHS20C11_16210 [Lysobacteraceae bacterium]|nr:MAG: hypothetical protein DHS20C11_16210 [Xanthomonadaceae bacterium]
MKLWLSITLLLLVTACNRPEIPKSIEDGIAPGTLDRAVEYQYLRVRQQLQQSNGDEIANNWQHMADWYFAYGHYGLAVTAYETAQLAGNDALELDHMLGLAYLNEGRPEQALTQFVKVTSHSRDFVPALLGAGRASEQLGYTNDAKKYFSQAAELDENCIPAILALVRLTDVEMNSDKTGTMLRHAYQLDSRSVPVIYAMARYERKHGNHDVADQLITTIGQEKGEQSRLEYPDPWSDRVRNLQTSVQAHLNRAKQFEAGGVWQRANNAYQMAIAADDNNLSATVAYVEYLLRTKRIPLAERIADQGLQRFPESTKLVSYRGRARLGQGNLQGGLLDALRLVELQPDDAEIRLFAAQLCFIAEQFDRIESLMVAAPNDTINKSIVTDLIALAALAKQANSREEIEMPIGQDLSLAVQARYAASGLTTVNDDSASEILSWNPTTSFEIQSKALWLSSQRRWVQAEDLQISLIANTADKPTPPCRRVNALAKRRLQQIRQRQAVSSVVVKDEYWCN